MFGLGVTPPVTAVDKFCRCANTLEQMLKDRGYKLANRFDHIQVRDRLRALDLADAYHAQVLLNDDEFAIEGVHTVSGDHVKVYWLCGKIGVNSPTLEKVKTAMLEASASSKTTNTVIFVAFEGASVSAPAKKEASTIPATIEYFDSYEIQQNITTHELQPKFKLLTDQEASRVKHMYGAKDEQLPKMLMDDPIRRYFGAKKGQVFQCKRLAENGTELM